MKTSFLEVFISIVGAVISGVLVRFLGEIWKERYLDPIHSFKLLRGRIEAALVFYKNKYTVLVDKIFFTDNDRKIYYDMSSELRALASELASAPSVMPKSRQKLPSDEKILEASKQLIGLSNNVPCVAGEGVNMSQENRKHEEEIRKLLGITNKK